MPLPALILAASFALCSSAPRVTCVVDGDTFWINGEKVRIADINTPEIHRPECPDERGLGWKAARRLVVLLNAGPFELVPGARERDRYGRLLRVIRRDGQSLGQRLVAEGLAERWTGRRGSWCPLPGPG